jgi:hypothetical protein
MFIFALRAYVSRVAAISRGAMARGPQCRSPRLVRAPSPADGEYSAADLAMAAYLLVACLVAEAAQPERIFGRAHALAQRVEEPAVAKLLELAAGFVGRAEAAAQR